MSAVEKGKVVQKLIAENWRDGHKKFFGELTEDNRTKIDIHNDLCNLLFWDVSGLRIALRKLKMKKLVDNGECEELEKTIKRLDEISKQYGNLENGYWDDRADKEHITPGEQISQLHGNLNPYLRSAIGEAEALLVEYRLLPVADPDELLDEMIDEMSEDDGDKRE